MTATVFGLLTRICWTYLLLLWIRERERSESRQHQFNNNAWTFVDVAFPIHELVQHPAVPVPTHRQVH